MHNDYKKRTLGKASAFYILPSSGKFHGDIRLTAHHVRILSGKGQVVAQRADEVAARKRLETLFHIRTHIPLVKIVDNGTVRLPGYRVVRAKFTRGERRVRSMAD